MSGCARLRGLDEHFVVVPEPRLEAPWVRGLGAARLCAVNDAAPYWFSPAPSEVSSSRISLDFGLRAADLSFRELVVPELGRIWFVRQLSWPLAALALHASMREQGATPPKKPTAICHGIESLACKLEYLVNPGDPSSRILGRRAFARDADSEIWSFERLRQPAHYVRNTHRQAATRAIRADGGLGFATGSRFDLLQLEPIGMAVADAFLEQKVGKGGTSLRRWLVGWIRNEKDMPGWSNTLMAALSPEHPTAREQALVRSRVLEISTLACATRQRLARAIGRAAELPDIEDVVVPRLRAEGLKKQADEVLAARSFGAMLDRARDAAAALTVAVEPGRGGVPISVLERDKAVTRTLDALATAAKSFVKRAAIAGVTESTSLAFADAILQAKSRAAVIRLVVSRVGQVLSLSEKSVIRGALFRVIDGSESVEDLEEGAASIEPDKQQELRRAGVTRDEATATGRTFRIANLHVLLRDARATATA